MNVKALPYIHWGEAVDLLKAELTKLRKAIADEAPITHDGYVIKVGKEYWWHDRDATKLARVGVVAIGCNGSGFVEIKHPNNKIGRRLLVDPRQLTYKVAE